MKSKLKLLLFTLVISANVVAGDAEYFDAKVTGVGFKSGSGPFYFTIDKTDSQTLNGHKIVWTSAEYVGTRERDLYSLVLSAYTSGKPVAFLSWGASDGGGYIKVRAFQLGKRQDD